MYLLSDYTVLEAETPEQLVRQMHALSLAPAKNDAAWMDEVSKRT